MNDYNVLKKSNPFSSSSSPLPSPRPPSLVHQRSRIAAQAPSSLTFFLIFFLVFLLYYCLHFKRLASYCIYLYTLYTFIIYTAAKNVFSRCVDQSANIHTIFIKLYVVILLILICRTFSSHSNYDKHHVISYTSSPSPPPPPSSHSVLIVFSQQSRYWKNKTKKKKKEKRPYMVCIIRLVQSLGSALAAVPYITFLHTSPVLLSKRTCLRQEIEKSQSMYSVATRGSPYMWAFNVNHTGIQQLGDEWSGLGL